MNLKEIIGSVGGYNQENLGLYNNSDFLDMWEEWYSGNVKSFHNYKVYNGKKHINLKRYSLGMAKKVCEDWANLLMNEKTDITLSDENSQKILENIFEQNDFWLKANKNVEKYMALGIGAWVLSVDNLSLNEYGEILDRDAKIKISFMYGDKIIPITIKDDDIVECAFISIFTGGANICIHKLAEDGTYDIINIKATGSNDNYTFNEDDVYVFSTHSDTKWFQILQPNIVNNIDVDSPLGVSVFANSIDTLKEIDLVFDSLQNEFALGKKRVFINVRETSISMKSGEEVETFDTNDVVFYYLPESDDGKQLIQDSTQTLRVNDHQVALQQLLNILSYQCGFGTEHYKFNAGSVSTATQIISENSEMFRNIKKHEILIEKAFINFVKAIIYAVNTFTSNKMNASSEIEVKFDDSIIEDKTSEIANDRLDVSMGVMSKAEYRSKWYGEPIKEAEAKINEINVFTIEDYDNNNQED